MQVDGQAAGEAAAATDADDGQGGLDEDDADAASAALPVSACVSVCVYVVLCELVEPIVCVCVVCIYTCVCVDHERWWSSLEMVVVVSVCVLSDTFVHVVLSVSCGRVFVLLCVRVRMLVCYMCLYVSVCFVCGSKERERV